MASYATSQGPEILSLKIDDIFVGPRIGFFWPDKAEALGKLIATDGQNDPVKVRKAWPEIGQPWVLVAGLHRLRGMKMEGFDKISAIEVLGDEDALMLIEASENIHRRNFPPLEKALFLRAVANVYQRRFREGHEGLSDQQIGQIKRWEAEKNKVQVTAAKKADLEAEAYSGKMTGLYGWMPEVGAAIGLGDRAVRDYLYFYSQICEPFSDRVEELARHPLGQKRKSLLEIADIPSEPDRGALIDWILRDDAIQTVQDAKVRAGLEKAVPKLKAEGQTKFLNNAESNLDRLTASTWRSWAPALVERIKPSALLTVRAKLDERIADAIAKGELQAGDDT